MTNTKSTPSVYVAFGFHINTLHSYRIDSEGERGFGKDLRMIRKILDTLDAANGRGCAVRGVWDMDQLFSVEECLMKHGSDILDRIRARVSAGDEVIHMSYNNGLVSAMTEDELDSAIEYSRSNQRKSGLHDLFGVESRIVRPQEMMTTPGSFDIYQRHGIDTVCLYHSATPFDAMRFFIDPLSAEAAHNPLRFERPDGDRMRVLPTYHTVDLVEHVSLSHWVRELNRKQQRGEITRDVLLFINFDADHESWGGFDVPGPLRSLPNVTGLDGMIASIESLEYVTFTTLSDYLEEHDEVAEITFDQDTADGAWNGYASWAEKYSSHMIFSAVSDDRRRESVFRRLADHLPDTTRAHCESLREEAFTLRLRLLSTTNYGLATPFVAPGREERAVNDVKRLYDIHRRIDDAIASAAGDLKASDASSDGTEVEIRDTCGTLESLLYVTGDLGMIVHLSDDLIDRVHSRSLHLDREGERPRTQRIGSAAGEPTSRILMRSKPEPLGVSEGVSLIDRDGGLVLAFRGQTLLTAESFIPTITYADSTFAGSEVRINRDGSRNVVTIAGNLSIPGQRKAGRFEYNISQVVVGDAPLIFVDGQVTFPESAPDTVIHRDIAGLERAYDARWKAVEPCPVRLARVEYEQNETSGAVVSRRNALGRVASYAVNYHRRNREHWYFDSSNNHVTQPWCALSVNNVGVAVGFDEAVLSSFAGTPIRSLDPADRKQPMGATTPGAIHHGRPRVFDLNPFGAYDGRPWIAQSWGRGLGTRVIEEQGEHLSSGAPTYNGRTLSLSLVLAPFADAVPRPGVQEALMLACRPAVMVSMNRNAEVQQAHARSTGRSAALAGIEHLTDAQSVPPGVGRRQTRRVPVSAGTLVRLIWQSIRRPRLRFPG